MSPLLFYFLAGMIVIPAIAVVQSRNLFHAGLSMIVSFLGIAGIYVALAAPFVAGMQVMVYAGAIAVILLFAFMLTHDISQPLRETTKFHQASAAVVSFLLGGAMLRLLFSSGWERLQKQPGPKDLTELGSKFLTDFLVPFELVSILLLMTLVGAIVIARKEETDKIPTPADDVVPEQSA